MNFPYLIARTFLKGELMTGSRSSRVRRILSGTILPGLLFFSSTQLISPDASASTSTNSGTTTDLHNAVTSNGVPPSVSSLADTQTPAAGRDVIVYTKATAPNSVPGGSAGFFVIVSNSGKEATSTASATAITLTIPKDTTFGSITDLSGTSLAGVPAPSGGAAGATWVCASPTPGASGDQVRCEFGTAAAGGSVVPAPIAGQSAIAAFVELRVDAKISTNATGVERTFRVSLSTPGNNSTTDTSSSANFLVTTGAPVPDFFPDVSGTPSVTGNQAATETIQMLNVGSGPATASGGQPVVRLDNLLPATLLADWTSSGTGWTCTGAATAAPSCTYDAPSLAVGAMTAPLTLTYHLDPLAVSKLGLVIGGKSKIEQWKIGIGPDRKNSLAQSYQNQIAIVPQEGSSLYLEATVAGGLDQLVPGGAAAVDVKVSNIGAVATSGALVVAGSLPPGVILKGTGTDPTGTVATSGSQVPWTCKTAATVFSCEPVGEVSIPAAGSTQLVLNVEVATNATAGDGILALQAKAQNEDVGAKVASAEVRLFVLPDNVGFPTVSLFGSTGSTAPAPVTDGAPTALYVGGVMNERLDVTNSGGAAIPAGSEITLQQRFTAGVKIRAIVVQHGQQCTKSLGVTPSVSCAVHVSSAMAPRATITGPKVVLVATRPTKGVANWTVTERLNGAKAPPSSTTGVYVNVGTRAPNLIADLSSTRLPTAGGFGRWTVSILNNGNTRTASRVNVVITVPRDASDVSGRAKGWSCNAAKPTLSGQPRIACASATPLRPSRAFRPIGILAKVPAADARRSFVVAVVASSGRARRGTIAKDSMTVMVRGAIHALIKAPDTVVLDDVPLTSLSQSLTPSNVTLEGDGSGGNGLGLTYHWVQRCTTTQDVAAHPSQCSMVTPAVKWINEPAGTKDPSLADVMFVAPPVKVLTPLVFELFVSDGSATATAFTKIKIVPPTAASKGFALERPHPTKQPSMGPSSEKTQLPSAVKPVSVVSKTPTQSGAKATSMAIAPSRPIVANLTSMNRTAPTNSARETTTTTLAGTTGTSNAGLPALFCTLVSDAASGQSLSTTISGVELKLANISISGSGCSTDTKVSFSDSSLKLGSILSATGVAGTIGSDGLHFSSGTISGPSDWHAPTFSMTPDPSASGIVLSYNANDGLSMSGVVSGNGFAFLPLPSQWSGTTTLTFAASGSGFTAAVSANATGPASDTSPNTPRPKVTLTGSVASDGTFSLNASATDVVQLDGSAINLSGSVARATAGGPIETTIAGSLSSPLKIVNGLSLDTLNVKVQPTANSLGLTGSGTVSVTSGSTTFGFNVNLSYSDPKNWSLSATGTGTSSWTPLSGLTITPSDAHGSIAAVNGAYQFSLELSPQSSWTPKTGVTISNIVLSLSNVCPDSGAPCPTGASLFLRVAGDGSFSLPIVGAAQTHISGVIALPSGAFSVEASLTNALSIGGGISIDQAKVEMSRGLSVPVGTATPLIDTADPAGLSISVQGSVTIPKIGTVPSVIASWSSSGWVIAANLGSYSLPGAGGNGTTLSDTVIGWSSFDTSLNVVDPTTKVKTSIPLPANAFEISGSYAAPDWFKQVFKLSSDVKGRATGMLNLSTGEFALKMSLAASPDWYLYGSSTTSTSVRLDSVYFNVERKGADFSVALGGTAALVVPGVTSADPLSLGIAIGYSAATTTLGGTFTLHSKTGWQNAFGVNGLTLSDLALSFQLNIATLTPAVGFGATAILPSTLRDPLGMPSNVKTTLVANISVSNPCFGIEVDDPTQSGANVLNIGSGAFTATQLRIQIAPSGCTVGQFHYDPGISVNFNGAILGVPVAVKAVVATSPFKLDANLDVGEFKVAGVVVDHTKIAVLVSSNALSIAFAGGIHVLGASVTVSGGYAQNGPSATIDLHGALDNLALSPSLNIKKATVDMHVVVGKSPSVKFSATGSIDLLGSSVYSAFSLNVDNGQLVEVTAAIKANITVGGTGGVNLNGTFNLDYGPSIPFVVNADVAVSVGGFQFAHATALLNSSGFTLTTDFTIGNVLTARLTGAMYYGTPPPGTTIAGPNNTKVAAKTGDFLFSAHDVSINLAGFKANGSVDIGRAGGTAWGAMATKIQLLGSASGNSIAIRGSFSGNGDFSLSGTGNLSLIGVNANVTASVVKSGGNVTVNGSASLSVLGSSVAVSGTFASNNGSPLFRLTGSANLNLGGYNVGSASFFFSNFPQDAGLMASINTNIGSVLTLAGRLTITDGTRFYLSVNGNLDLKVLSTTANIVFTNCNFTYTTTYTTIRLGFGITFKIPHQSNPVCSSSKAATLDANATISASGFSFGVSVHVDTNGNFRATASSPSSGTYNGDTGSLYLAVVAFYASLSYRMSLTIQNTEPYLSVSGYGSGDVYGKTWDVGWFYAGWGSWHQIVGITASIETNPFHACGSARVWGVSFGPACI